MGNSYFIGSQFMLVDARSGLVDADLPDASTDGKDPNNVYDEHVQ